MSNRGASSGGVEHPIAPQPGPSQPPGRHKSGASSKRKALDEEETEAGTSKRPKSSQVKHKTVKGEKKAGGLIINPIIPPSSAPPVPSSSTSSIIPLPRASSAQGSSQPKRKPPEKLNITKGDLSVTTHTARSQKGDGKGKKREVMLPTRQDLEVDEDVRRMDEERERLRARDVETQAKSVEFKTPLLPKSQKSSLIGRRRTEFAFGSPRPTPDNVKSLDSMQPLPVRDTPTIDRNRAMRGEPVKRRSSMTLRGKRASNSFENSGVIPQPHPSVSTSNFHKHVDLELPEAHRARHLLVWCSARKSMPPGRSQAHVPPPQPDNSQLPPLTAEGMNILHEVQKEVQKMLTEQRIDISFGSHMDEDGDKPKVKEHEQNAKNRKREDDFMRHIERCKREDGEWAATIQSYNARQASTLDALARKQLQSDYFTEWTYVSSLSHDRELQGAQLAQECNETASRKREESPLAMRIEEVENKIDRVHSALHISDQLTRRTMRHLSRRFEGLAEALAARSQPPVQPSEISVLASLASANPNPPSATGLGAPPDTLSILRALARTDVERPQREMGDAARRAAREVQRANASGRGSVGGTGKLTAVAVPTPRKTPGTPRRPGTPRQTSEGAEGGR